MRSLTSSTGVLLAATVSAALLTGCGSSSDDSGLPSVSTSAQTRSGGGATSATPSGQAYTQCMRDHGVQMADPDPKTGQPKFDSSVNTNSATVKTALTACKNLLPAGTRGGADTKNLGPYLAFAKCMRQHGLPEFPDPQPGPKGLFPDSGVDRNSPAFQKASTACQSFLDKAGNQP